VGVKIMDKKKNIYTINEKVLSYTKIVEYIKIKDKIQKHKKIECYGAGVFYGYLICLDKIKSITFIYRIKNYIEKSFKKENYILWKLKFLFFFFFDFIGFYDKKLKILLEVISQYYDNKDGLTLKQLYDLTKIELIIYAYDILNKEYKKISYKEYPDLNIHWLVLCFSGNPIYTRPLFYYNSILIPYYPNTKNDHDIPKIKDFNTKIYWDLLIQ